MASRPDLQTFLEELLKSKNVYFQPPESVKMKYPAIVYALDDIENVHADNGVYSSHRHYSVTVIDSSSDAGKYASDIMAFPTTILVDRNGNIVGDPMLGGIDNQDNYDTLMKQIQSVIDADSTNRGIC